MNTPFEKSAPFYELIYQNKDYQKETDYLHTLLSQLHIDLKGKMLDIGCGTGDYISWYLKKNMQVTGLDISPEMLAIAEKKFPNVEFILGDIRSVKIQKQFNFAFMMFHVVNYLNSKENLLKAFQNISEHLIKGGVLVFDFWHGEAIEKDPPKNIEKVFVNDEFKVIRKTTPAFEPKKQLVDVCFDFSVYQNNKLTSSFQEHHFMRYLFMPEIELLLKNSGFALSVCNGWLKSSPITNEDWYGVLVARKIG